MQRHQWLKFNCSLKGELRRIQAIAVSQCDADLAP
jgi:hypothetical protein